ncbi:PREDICTED: uncharacterized protein LOC104801399 isoform X2 [Tarenaya hassleriana]|uniref:uncharacterized protein LOC104801399 isoform X2 n=1 Tax=Tarenaya hassleriana TaxID=28532 RepID=UPI0008FD91DC|nr:PREDICTED: uncharacterized protein LOC104801399 isoform X2 [Tarenaya hassleriana]
MPRPLPIGEIVRQFKGNHPGSHLFKIDNFSLLGKYEIKACESSVFELGDHKWKLILYPNKYGHVSIHFEKQDSEVVAWKYPIALFAASQFEKKWATGSPKCNLSRTTWKDVRVISHATLHDEEQGFLVDDIALFGVKIMGLADAKVGTAECFSIVENPPRNKITWKMINYTMFSFEDDHFSNEFVIGSRIWRIRIYPRGNNKGKGKSLSVYLSGDRFTSDALEAKTYVGFKLRLFDQIRRKHFQRSLGPEWYSAEPGEDRGFEEFAPLADIDDKSKGYLVDDQIFVGVQIDFVSMNNRC